MTQSIPRFDLEQARAAAGTGKRFWASIEELIDEDSFRALLAAEFPAAASFFDDPGRRQFLKLMGASLLLAGLAGCGETKSDSALPYVRPPEESIPGVPRLYATALVFAGYAQPVVATTYSGRPTKLDGNPDHPATRGKSDAFTQAALFGLYDPERSKQPRRKGEPTTWGNFAAALAALRQQWDGRQGDGLRLLTGATGSPTLVRQIKELQSRYPGLRWHRHEPTMSARQDEAMRLAFGQSAAPRFNFDRCEAIVSLDCDFLGPGPHQVAHALSWSQRHGEIAPGKGRSTLHVAEAVPSLTGSVASYRLACDPRRLGALAQALGAHFGLAGWNEPILSGEERHWLERAVANLNDHRGAGLLLVGAHLDASWQAMAVAVNDRLGNSGETVWYGPPIVAGPDATQTLAALAEDMAGGKVDSLVILDSNPAYTAPGGLQFSAALARVPNTIHAGLHVDETALACTWHLPLTHTLESWSDARAVDGSACIIQPVINPLYASRSTHQIIDMLHRSLDPAADAAVRTTWQNEFVADFDSRWRQALHDGFVANSQAPKLTLAAAIPAPPAPQSSDDGIEIVLQPDPTVWDGRFANIAWLQELPKPLSKITWDNVVAVSPALAANQGLANGDMVAVTVGDRRIIGPVWITPGQAKNTVALTFGYGRRAGGEIAADKGYDAYALLRNEATRIARGNLESGGGRYALASMQTHHRLDGFDLVREVTATHPQTPPPKEQWTFYPDWNEEQGPENEPAHAWGMVIDLDLCIGCNACVAACNAENNVLVVGKDQVMRGREMLWLRVDHYYSGDPADPRNFFQPVPCMHCEKAPCEMGCPVHATAHSPDGINQMVYNRCIGTRTCSSYCPYKVRRFNWYDYRRFAEAEQAAKNPDVTVRSRGVMEKCSYCTQRIQAARIEADKDNRPLRRDEVVTACQQACPTAAIVFGDLKDEGSAVSQRRRSGRHYVLLEELGTRPRTTYLARWDDREGGPP